METSGTRFFLLLAEVRKLAESGGTLEDTTLPVRPSEWLEALRTREDDGTEGVAAEYQAKHGADWGAVVYLERYSTMAPILNQLGVKVNETQQPVIPLKKSGWPWTTPNPKPN